MNRRTTLAAFVSAVVAVTVLVGLQWWSGKAPGVSAQELIYLNVVGLESEYFLPREDPTFGRGYVAGESCVFLNGARDVWRPRSLVIENEQGSILVVWQVEGVIAHTDYIGSHCRIDASTRISVPVAAFYRVSLDGEVIGAYAREDLPSDEVWALPIAMNYGID